MSFDFEHPAEWMAENAKTEAPSNVNRRQFQVLIVSLQSVFLTEQSDDPHHCLNADHNIVLLDRRDAIQFQHRAVISSLVVKLPQPETEDAMITATCCRKVILPGPEPAAESTA
jgi:hypothetical protein